MQSTMRALYRPTNAKAGKNHKCETPPGPKCHDPTRDVLAPVGWHNLGPKGGLDDFGHRPKAIVLLYRQTGPQASSPKPQKNA